MATPTSVTIPPALIDYESMELAEMTDAGVGIRARPPALTIRSMVLRALRAQLESGPFLAAFDAGLLDAHDEEPRNSDRISIVFGERPLGPRALTVPVPYTTLAQDCISWLARMRQARGER